MSSANKFKLKNNLSKEQLDCIKKFHQEKLFSYVIVIKMLVRSA